MARRYFASKREAMDYARLLAWRGKVAKVERARSEFGWSGWVVVVNGE